MLLEELIGVALQDERLRSQFSVTLREHLREILDKQAIFEYLSEIPQDEIFSQDAIDKAIAKLYDGGQLDCFLDKYVNETFKQDVVSQLNDRVRDDATSDLSYLRCEIRRLRERLSHLEQSWYRRWFAKKREG